MPDGDVLEAELLVPARAIGFINPGQSVHLSYDTFPFQQFGFARGSVRTVSRTFLKPDEIVGPMLLREPSYRVAVALERQTIRAYGAELPLEPDLQLQAEPVIRPTLLRRFLAGTRRVSPVAQHVLVTVLSLPPRRGEQPYRSVFGWSFCLRPTVAGPRGYSFSRPILFERRTLLAWILDPLLSAWGRS